jgi:type IV secretion system protein VirD4
LGKETIDTNTYGKSTGHSGNYSTNYQIAGRELLTQDEVRMLDNNKAILLIRGEKPIVDNKYDILKHPNVKYTTDGKATPYKHGKTDRVNASILKLNPEDIDMNKFKDIRQMKQNDKVATELLSEEDIENYYIMEEYENERNKENNQ